MSNWQRFLFLVVLVAAVSSYPEEYEGKNPELNVHSLELPTPTDVCTASECPKWSFCENGSTACRCPKSDEHILNCNLYKQLLILDCYCITYDKEEQLFEFGLCSYTCGEREKDYSVGYHRMPLDVSEWQAHVCGRFNRTGALCGKCDGDSNLYQRAYSFDLTCIQCTSSIGDWFKYIISAFLPLTIFCLVILVFKLNIYSSQLQGFVLYSQFMTISALSRVLFRASKTQTFLFQTVKLLSAIYGIWNLDFFRMYYPGYCLKIGSLGVLSLDFIIALYPMFFMGLTLVLVRLYDQNFKPLVFLWKPIGAFLSIFQQNWDTKTSAIDSFSTFFFLSNMKFLSVCFDILVPVRVYYFRDPRMVNYTWRLYYDATVPYFKDDHLYYGIAAILSLILFVFLPVFLLLLYPFRLIQKTLRVLSNRWQIILLTFVDSFQGCYKDGIKSGTKDCRWFSATILIARFAILLAYAISLDAVSFAFSTILFTIIALLIITVDPFKEEHGHLSLVLVMYMIILASFHVCGCCLGTLVEKDVLIGKSVVYTVAVLAGLLPLVHVSALFLYRITQYRRRIRMY